MFSISLEEAIKNAEEAKACKEELDIIKSLSSIENVLSYEHLIYWLCWYAENVIQNRWLEAEECIKKDPEWTYYYTKNIIKNRWVEAEEYIKKNPEYAYLYSKDIIKDR